MELFSGRKLLGLWTLIVSAGLVFNHVVSAADFETPPVLTASDFLSEDLLEGEHYQVISEVENDGFMNTYRIASDFGRFNAYGEIELRVRVEEIAAIAELSEVSKAEVFKDSALAAVTRPVNAIKDFAERPEETIKGIGDGLGRMWGRVKRTAGEVKETIDEKREERAQESEEGETSDEEVVSTSAKTAAAAKSYAKKYFGASSAERRWAQKLGVDPYTTNETLRKAIREVARVDAAGGFTVKLVGVPSIPGAGVIEDVNELVWGKDPGELQEYNENLLLSMGATEEVIDEFFESPFFLSPTRQTRFITSLAAMDGVVTRSAALELALTAESHAEALYQVGAVAMLSEIHNGGTPLARLAPAETIPVGVTTDGVLLVAAPLDYVIWSSQLASAVEGLRELAERLGAGGSEVRFLGKISDRCRSELERKGWTVVTEFESS